MSWRDQLYLDRIRAGDDADPEQAEARERLRSSPAVEEAEPWPGPAKFGDLFERSGLRAEE